MQQPPALCAGHAVDEVVRRHDALAACFHTGLEARQINFAQRPLRDVLVDAHALRFLIVGGKMLDVGDHALRLHAAHQLRRQLCRQARILGIALKQASIARVPVDIGIW